MVHQPSLQLGAAYHSADLDVRASELGVTRDKLIRLLSEYTGKSPAELEPAFTRDTFMQPSAAVDFGLIDGVCTAWPGAE